MAYQLALVLGYASPMRMLREMSRQEWLEWQVYLNLDPLPSIRADIHYGVLVREIRNATVDPAKKPKGYSLDECLTRFGDDLGPAPTRTDWRKTKANLLQAFGVTRERKPKVEPAPTAPRAPGGRRGRRPPR